ncbi:ABC transporter permease [Ruminococcaceae bacterium OttesenSCG-928-I18]|nr:ABC transporter permease [Ruminococcaceae bacterium OttesenSCG-928-I18]
MRQIIEYAKMAFRNIVVNKMRSLLTMLGIIIGISSVIIVLSIGRGGQQQIEEELSSIANGSIYISVYGDDITESDYITDDDLDAIRKMPDVTAVTMASGVQGKALGTRGEEVTASISTGNGDMDLVFPSTMEHGRFWNESDYAAARQVCTVDSRGAKELFGSDNVVGMPVTLEIYGRSTDFLIVGVVKTEQPAYGPSITAEFTVPISTLSAITDEVDEPYYQVALLTSDVDRSARIAENAVTLLEQRHENAGRELYHPMDVSSYIDQFNQIIGMFSGIIAAIAGISLLVGGIGVMNIMLVSVTERTREIGIRKALGAKTRTILFQFLIESATLTLFGGLIGIAVGMAGGYLAGNALGLSASITPQMVLAIVVFSSAIGIFFGIYPARKAARLNPIEALRSE